LSLSPEVLDLLRKTPLFSGLTDELLTRHLYHSGRVPLAAGQILLSPGDSNENVYVILSGRLRVNPGSPDSESVAIFGAGESVGEMSILDDSRAFAYLVADSDCELLCVDLATIWSLLNGSHQAARNMLNILAMRLPINERSNLNTESRQGYAGLNHVDELTGLYNSQWMFQTFGRQIHRCAINHDHASLMMVSIDQFKHYNQCHGRLGGDQALRTIAQTILTCLRPNDQAAHYHGKVFAVFLPHTTLEEARKASQRLLLQASQAVIVTPSGDSLPHVTISIGLTEVRAENSLKQLIEQATAALQRARQAGRNRVSD
jgi:diguanylate cyclase (GGDEF)-like protein